MGVLNVAVRRDYAVWGAVEMRCQKCTILVAGTRPGYVKGMSVNGLVEYLMVSRQSLNGVLRRMEESGYIERVVNPDDLRSRQIRLTPYGREVCKKVEPKVKKFYRDSVRHMTEEERVNSLNLLNQILGNMRQK